MRESAAAAATVVVGAFQMGKAEARKLKNRKETNRMNEISGKKTTQQTRASCIRIFVQFTVKVFEREWKNSLQ